MISCSRAPLSQEEVYKVSRGRKSTHNTAAAPLGYVIIIDDARPSRDAACCPVSNMAAEDLPSEFDVVILGTGRGTPGS